MKKVLYLRTWQSYKQCVLLKGHFLLAAETLKQSQVFCSCATTTIDQLKNNINFIRVVSVDGPFTRMFGLFLGMRLLCRNNFGNNRL